jgi:hypothetical protein
MNRPHIGLRILLLCCFCFLLVAGPVREIGAQQSLSRNAHFETILKYYTCGHASRANYVVTDRDQWATVWGLAMSNVYPVPPAPEIDFDTQSVIAVFEGNEPSSDYSIAVKKLVRSKKGLSVVVEEVVPEDACKVLLVVTQPFHIVVTEKVPESIQVSFKLKQRVKICQDPLQ